MGHQCVGTVTAFLHAAYVPVHRKAALARFVFPASNELSIGASVNSLYATTEGQVLVRVTGAHEHE